MKLLAKQAESSKPFETVQKEIEAEIETERRRKAFYDFDIKLVQQAEVDNTLRGKIVPGVQSRGIERRKIGLWKCWHMA
ncbi:MAG: hypothetical protein ACYS71_03810 [Planctomycetota bacterium]|jgi:hypothetical protein